ncbi:hypothetical protein BMT54_07655 [Pasteurellaceae bacterium 15-036681]|nr:hypothetical protein BMT54_07655 [Pasteurellaceae bacterium 15-036681]
MKKKINTNLFKKFKQNNLGSVTVEFAFMLLLLGSMLIFMVDLILSRSTMGKLDTVSYSLVNVLKERSRFYAKSSEITVEDVSKLQKIAGKLLYDDPESQKVQLSIEQLTHKSDGSVNPIIKLGNKSCHPGSSLKKELSPYSQSNRLENRQQLSVYQVTLCIPVTSPFKYFLLRENNYSDHIIRSSSIGVGR